MNPAPLCKTAIISFIFDKIPTKLWNISSNMRKRVKMVIGDRDIIVREYNPKALVFNGWVKVGREEPRDADVSRRMVGISNIKLTEPIYARKFSRLNGKLRCGSLTFCPEKPLDFDSIEELFLHSSNIKPYLQCSFNRIKRLTVLHLRNKKLTQFLSRVKRVDFLNIESCYLSEIDLRNLNIKKIAFNSQQFKGTVNLPVHLEYLEIGKCKGLSFLNFRRVDSLRCWFENFELENSADIISKQVRGVKVFRGTYELETCFKYLPSSIRVIEIMKLNKEDSDFALELKKKFPFLLEITTSVPIKFAQILNLRKVYPMMDSSGNAFKYRPKEIMLGRVNLSELKKHLELFKKVKRIYVDVRSLGFGDNRKKSEAIKILSSYNRTGERPKMGFHGIFSTEVAIVYPIIAKIPALLDHWKWN